MNEARRFPDVMLLAAGAGARLTPLTETCPEALLEVGGMTLIDRAIANARAEGASRFLVNAHHLADQVVAHFAGHPDFTVLREPELLGTGGAVRDALGRTDADPVLAMAANAFWPTGADRPLARLIARHKAARASITLLCVFPMRASGVRRSHDFCLDPLGRITPDSGLPVLYAGVALISRAAFADAPQGPFALETLFEAARAEEKLAGALLDAPWFHVGSTEGLAAAREAMR